MLRGRLPDNVSEYPKPVRGVNLRKSVEDLLPEESELESNCFYDSGLRTRFGRARFTTVSLGMNYGLGATKAYFADGSTARVVAFDTNLVEISDAGAISTITSTLSSGRDTHFRQWSVTDRLYLCNRANSLMALDSAGAFASVTGSYIPQSPTMAVPYLDRLCVLQGNVVVITDSYTDSVFSPTTSSWAAFRGIGGSGNPTAIALHSATGTPGDPQAQLLIFQANTTTALVGSDLGSNVTAASPPTGFDGQLILLDPRIGTSSPYSVCNVPGVGTFWFTTNRNVVWLPIGQSIPRMIGNSLYSYRSGILGLNDVSQTNLGQVVMEYHDLKLKLYLPVNGQTYSTIQYWLDLRPVMENLAAVLTAPEGFPANWSGPHTGQAVRRVWTENQGNDNDLLMGIEGDPTNGLMVYEQNPVNYYRDDVGVSTSSEIYYRWESFYNPMGAPGYQKHLYDLWLDVEGYINLATVSVSDIHATLTDGFSILRSDGSAFSNITYGNGFRYGNGTLYGQGAQNNLGHVNFTSRGTVVPYGDALKISVHCQQGHFAVNRVLPHAKIQRVLPVT